MISRTTPYPARSSTPARSGIGTPAFALAVIRAAIAIAPIPITPIILAAALLILAARRRKGRVRLAG